MPAYMKAYAIVDVPLLPQISDEVTLLEASRWAITVGAPILGGR